MTEYLSNILSHGSIVTLPAALAAGVVAGLNPCCLPIYPAAVGCCTACRRQTVQGNLGMVAAFVLGTSLMTTVLGIATAFGGRVFGGLGPWAGYLIAALPIAFGLHLMGAMSIPMPGQIKPSWKPKGLIGVAGIGALLGLVITPCTTPILAGLLSYVAVKGDPIFGGLLLFAYGVGIGIPVLLLGTAAASLVSRLSSEIACRATEYISGAIMVGVGLYLLWIV